MIEIKELSKSFDKKNVLDNLNCLIKDECIYGLVGANGAGKSTLLRIIASVYMQDKGEILIDCINSFDNKEVKQNIVFVPDDLFFFNGYSLKQMAEFYKVMYKNFDMDYLNELVKTLKLEPDKKINTLSKGLKRQTALVLALATNAKYMLFDETFDGIDPVVRNLLKKILAKHMERAKSTVIMTSHNLRELEDICDNLGLLFKGGILFESEVDKLKTNMFKVQISLKEDFDENTFSKLNVLSYKKRGSVATLIVKDERKKAEEILEKLNPVILDFLPLTLEEIFIYEMEVLGYAFEDVI